MFRLPRNTVMTTELLAEYIGKHKRIVNERYSKLKSAYENDYAIFHQEAKEPYKPDNRISVNFAKYITDTFNGFFIGNPIKVQSDDGTVNEYIQFLDNYNDQDDNNAELSKICSIYGKGYEMYFVDEEGNIGITYLNPTEAFIIYDESIVEKPLFFVRYYMDYKNVERGSWSDGVQIQYFYSKGSYKWEDEPHNHGFDGVPATEYVENAERLGLFESALPMINAYNKAVSEKANDIDYFADAYLKVLGALLDNEGLQKIRDNRIINFDEDASGLVVEFMQKPNADTSQENLLNRLERLIYQISMVANINDENFGTSSGIALKYKLLSMTNLAKTKERKFVSGMNRRYRLIFSNPVSMMNKDAWVGIKYNFTFNIPANVSDEASVASQLEGVVSKETQLSVLSIVDDVQSELDKINAEDAQNALSIVDQRMFDDSLDDSNEQAGGE
uniref:phage portal protein n=1 Tax=Thomasclavelia spiroformis TaxID=29348 RepID=UPI00359C2FC8